MTWLVLFIGLLIGGLSGVIGIGGGTLMVPALMYFFQMSQHKAQGTSLGALLAPVGILAFWEYYRHGNADLRIALLLAGSFTVGAFFGGMGAQHVPDLLLRKVFAVVLVVVGVHMWLQK